MILRNAEPYNRRMRGGLVSIGALFLVIVRGNPSIRVSDVRNVEMVMKDGVGYDPAALVEAARGSVSESHIDSAV